MTIIKSLNPLIKAMSKGVYTLKSEAFQPLLPHVGKVCLLTLESQPPIKLQVTDMGWQWVESEHHDLEIIASLSQLIRLSLSQETGAHVLMKYQVKALGDIAFLQDCQKSLTLAKPDWAHGLSTLTSDLIAETLLRALKSAGQQVKAQANHRAQDVADYMMYESETMLAKEPFESFKRDLQSLQLEIAQIQSSLQSYKRCPS